MKGSDLRKEMYLLHYCTEGLNHVAHIHRHSWPATQGREEAACISFTSRGFTLPY